MIPPPVMVMRVASPPAGIGKTHRVRVVKIENRALAVWWRVRRRDGSGIVRVSSAQSLHPVRVIGLISSILETVCIFVMTSRPHRLVRQARLAAGGNLSSVNGFLGSTLQRIHS